MNEAKLSKILEKISAKRYKAMEDADALLEEMITSKVSYSDYAWSAVALELYLCGRVDAAIKAMLLAAIEGEKLEGEEKIHLAVIYAELSMMHEDDKDYEAAYEAMKKSYEIRKALKGENDISTRLDEESVNRLALFKQYKKDDALWQEFLNSGKEKAE